MNINLTDTALDDALRTLDPADAVLSPEASARGDALLSSIVDPEPADGNVVPLRHRTRTRWLRIGVAAATLAVAGMMIPGFIAPKPAYASWTPVPADVAPDVKAKAVETCKAELARSAEPMQGIAPDQQPVVLGEPRVAIAEQRGDYVLIALTTENGAELSCLFAASDPGTLISAGGALPTALSDTTPPPADGILCGGAGYQSVGDDAFANVIGRAGADVKAVTIHSGDKTIQASVQDGNFAAWWPLARGVDPGAAHLDDLVFDVTLTDGRVITDAYSGFNHKAAPGPREVGQISIGGGAGENGQPSQFVEGSAGAEVVGVVVHYNGVDVTATVANGRFKAEWTVPSTGAPGEFNGGTGSVDFSFTLTLADGTVLDHVQAVS